MARGKAKVLPGQLVFEAFLPKSDWKATPVSELPSWRDAKRVCIDCETHDPHLKELGIGVRRDGYVCGVAFAIEDGPAYYLPVRHGAADENLPEEQVWAYLRDQAKFFEGDLVGAYMPYDDDYLKENGVDFKSAKYRDVQNAEPLIYELRRSFSLDSLAELYQLPGKDETLLTAAASALNVDPKGGMAKLPARYVGPYALQDVRLPLQVLRRQERKLQELELWEAWEDECAVLPILVNARRRGIRIDVDQMEREELWSLQEQEQEIAQVRAKTGVNLSYDDVWKAEALAPVFDAIGADYEMTPSTGKPSITKEWLAAVQHPVANSVLRARRMDKYRNTFLAALRRYQVNGRIHCTFNQLRRDGEDREEQRQRGTISHRFSAEHLNPQQALKRDQELGPRYRCLYLPDEGALWASADWSQQEPRTIVHYAYLCGLPGAAEARDAYINDPDMDYHQFMSDLTGLRRILAKQVFLARCYGAGGKKLCNFYLNLPTKMIRHRRGHMIEVAGDEAQEILNQFDEKAPFVRKLANRVSNAARRRGYVVCLSGARRNFPKLPNGQHDWTHKALNALVQTSCARQMKKALVAVEAAGHPQQLIVHDEFDWSVESPEAALPVKEIMENVVQLSVPYRADLDIGNSWGEAAFPKEEGE